MAGLNFFVNKDRWYKKILKETAYHSSVVIYELSGKSWASKTTLFSFLLSAEGLADPSEYPPSGRHLLVQHSVLYRPAPKEISCQLLKNVYDI